MQEHLFNTQVGQYYKGDGEKFLLEYIMDFSLKNKLYRRQDFWACLFTYRNQAATSRGATYEGLIYLNYPPGATLQDSINIKQQDDLLVKSRGFNRRAVIDNAGNTKFISAGISINGGFPINDGQNYS